MSARILSHEEVAAIMTLFGFRKSDGEEWYVKWRGVVRNARTRGIECTLTFKQYMRLVHRAMLTSPSQIGMAVHQFNLARKGDVGGYVYGNCRFITSKQNRRERVTNGCFVEMALAKIGRTKDNSESIAKAIETKRIRMLTDPSYKTTKGHSKRTHKHCREASLRFAKRFKLTAPDGTVYRGSNLGEFCTEHGLPRSSMYRIVASGQITFRGWTGKYLRK